MNVSLAICMPCANAVWRAVLSSTNAMQWPWPASPVRTRHALHLIESRTNYQSCAACTCARLKLACSWRETQEKYSWQRYEVTSITLHKNRTQQCKTIPERPWSQGVHECDPTSLSLCIRSGLSRVLMAGLEIGYVRRGEEDCVAVGGELDSKGLHTDEE